LIASGENGVARMSLELEERFLKQKNF